MARRSSAREPVRALPKRDVRLHGYLGRHPMVVAAGEVLLPGPLVLQRQQLIDVGAAVDHRLVVDAHAALPVRSMDPQAHLPGRLRSREQPRGLSAGAGAGTCALQSGLLHQTRST